MPQIDGATLCIAFVMVCLALAAIEWDRFFASRHDGQHHRGRRQR